MKKILDYTISFIGVVDRLSKTTTSQKVMVVIALFIALNCAWVLSTLAFPLTVLFGILLWIRSAQ